MAKITKILFQFPEGIKPKARELVARYLRDNHLDIKNTEVYISSSPTFGGCDLSLTEAAMVDANKIVHYGHSKFVKHDLPMNVEYIEYHIDIRLDKFEEAIKSIKEKKLVLGTTVQHIHQIFLMKQILEENKKKVIIGKGFKTTYPGQLLGCDSLAVTSKIDEVDAILVVGTGLFHMLPINPKGKKIYVFNPSSNGIKIINNEVERWQKKRRGSIIAAMESKTFGILVSTKIGQYGLSSAKNIQKELVKLGKTVNIIVGDNLTPDTMINFGYECYITTACPRLIDDTDATNKPILDIGMYIEMKKLLKK